MNVKHHEGIFRKWELEVLFTYFLSYGPLNVETTCIHLSHIGQREPVVTGLLIGAKKCREAWGSYFV